MNKYLGFGYTGTGFVVQMRVDISDPDNSWKLDEDKDRLRTKDHKSLQHLLATIESAQIASCSQGVEVAGRLSDRWTFSFIECGPDERTKLIEQINRKLLDATNEIKEAIEANAKSSV